jgi:hypothetical protein
LIGAADQRVAVCDALSFRPSFAVRRGQLARVLPLGELSARAQANAYALAVSCPDGNRSKHEVHIGIVARLLMQRYRLRPDLIAEGSGRRQLLPW